MIDSNMGAYPQQKDWMEDRFFQALGWAVLLAHMSVQILACLMSPVGEYDDAIPLVSAELVRLGRTPSQAFILRFGTTQSPPDFNSLAGAFW